MHADFWLLIVVYPKLLDSHMIDTVINVAAVFSFVSPIPTTYFQRWKYNLFDFK